MFSAAVLLFGAVASPAIAQVTRTRATGTTAVPITTTTTTTTGTIETLTPVAPPAGPAPADVRAVPGPNNILIRWGCPSGPTGYEVFGTPTGGAQVKLTPTPLSAQCPQDLQLTLNQDPRLPAPTSTTPTYSTSFRHTGLAPGAEYTYLVRALYPNGISDATVVVAQTTPWPAPGGLVASLSSDRKGRLQWQPISGVSGYTIFRKLAGEAAFQKINIATGTASSYDDFSLVLPPGDHQYYVQANDGIASAPVTLAVGPWPAPTGLTVREISGGTTELRWDNVPGTNRYLVFRQLQGETSFRQITATPLNTAGFADNFLPKGQTHRYYVQAVDGQPSQPVAIASGTPSTVSIEAFRGNPVVRFSWNGASGANVSVTRSATTQGPFAPVIQATVDAAAGTASDPTATVGATQYYRLVFMYPTGAVQSDVLTAVIAAAPRGVTSVSAVALGGGAVKLSWPCDHEASGYSLMRGKDREALDWVRAPGSTTPLVVRPECEYTDRNLFAGSTYTYRVFGNYGYNEVAPNAVVSVRVQ